MPYSVIDLKEGEHGWVHHFTCQKIGSKLIMRGCLPNSEVKVIRIAPFGGGVYMKVDGHNIALRKSEAACIVLSE